MEEPTYSLAFQVLCLQAADCGRGQTLFGCDVKQVAATVDPFLVGNEFPSVYLEFPLSGEPFLDVTLLYKDPGPQAKIDSPAAPCADAMLGFIARVREEYDDVCTGFELDTSKPQLPQAAIHFQPRKHTELVEPFAQAIGEPDRAKLYLDLAKRMPKGWPLSFFGMFKGRPGSPLRVCGYLDRAEQDVCKNDPAHIADVFDHIGFRAYDAPMLEQVAELMRTVPTYVDFQFDIFDDGSIGSTFAVDAQFNIEQPAAVISSFESGPASHIMKLLEKWSIADERWRPAVQAAFARSLPVETEDGTTRRYAFTLMPQWAKIRWKDGVLQPAKLYYLANAGFAS